MPLTCSCDYDDDSEWYFYPPDYYSKLETKRRKRCCSCKELIGVGATVLRFYRIEQSIHGDEVPIAPWFMCERCGDIYFSLEELGFCIRLGEEPMTELLQEYRETYGAKERCNQT